MSTPAQSNLVLAFLTKVLEKNEDLLSQINCSDEDIGFVDDDLVFSLTGLQASIDELAGLDHSEFRRIIYHSTINQQLSNCNAQLVVHESTGKVDKNRYRLKRLNKI